MRNRLMKEFQKLTKREKLSQKRSVRAASVPALTAMAFAVGLSALVAAPQQATAGTMLENALRLDDGYTLPLETWEASGSAEAVIVAVHGVSQYAGDFAAMGTWMASQQVTTYAYHMRGFGRTATHGAWPGGEQLADDLTEVITTVQAEHSGLPVFVIGQGEGALVAIAGLGQDTAPSVQGLFLMSPTLVQTEDMGFLSRNIASAFPLAEISRLDHLRRKYRPGTTNKGDLSRHGITDNTAWLKAWEKNPVYIHYPTAGMMAGVAELGDLAIDRAGAVKTRLLVSYGLKNQDVTPLTVRKLLTSLRVQPRLAVYDEGYHLLHVDSVNQTMFADARVWFQSALKILPSGATKDSWSRLVSTSKRHDSVMAMEAPYWNIKFD